MRNLGDTLSRGTRRGLRIATFLAPVAVGSAIAFAIINPSEEPTCVPDVGCTVNEPAMSDETVLMTMVGGGAFLGFVAQQKFARALWPRARVGLAPDGRGVSVTIPVGW